MANMDSLKVEAEIVKLLAESSKLNAERTKLDAEVMKMSAEVVKLRSEARWHPLIVGAAFIAGLVAVVQMLHH